MIESTMPNSVGKELSLGHRTPITLPDGEPYKNAEDDRELLPGASEGETSPAPRYSNVVEESRDATLIVDNIFTSPFQNGHEATVSDVLRRQRRTQANAMFDPESLKILQRFTNRVSISLDEVNSWIENPTGWTKIDSLVTRPV